LSISNTVSFEYTAGNYTAVTNAGFLTNNGTVVWAATVYGYGGSAIYNAGLWQSVTDGTLSSQYGINRFINAGTLQKNGGTGTSTISWIFSNDGGTLDTFSGSFSFGNWIGSGTIHGDANLSASTI